MTSKPHKTTNAERLADWLRANGHDVWSVGNDWRTDCPYDGSDSLTFTVGQKHDPIFHCWGHEEDHTWPEVKAAMLRAGWPAELLQGAGGSGPQTGPNGPQTDDLAAAAANWLPEAWEGKVSRWHRRLTDGQRAYLREQRGLSDEVINKFQLGDDGERITIPIRDQQGKLLNVRRYQPSSKRFKMLNTDGHGTASLYPLHDWPDGEVVVLTEGELDCLAARSRGVPAVCGTAGATAFRRAWAEHFEGRTVYIAYDCDQSGRAGARKAAVALAPVARQVKIIDLTRIDSSNDPGSLIPSLLKEGEDLTDWFVKYRYTKEDFARLCKHAPAWERSEHLLASMSIAELLAKPRSRLWHVKGLMVHPTFGLIGGELKTLKTTWVIFTALALASGQWVFKRFPVERPLRVLLLVGENDEDSYAYELERIGAWYGLTPADIAAQPIRLVFETADVSSAKFQDTMEYEITTFRPDVVLLDPVYSYHGDDAEVSNLYSRAPLLRKFYAVAKRAGVSMWLADHFNQTGRGLHLKRFAQAGGGEVADSWILLAHRKPPDLNAGDFWLAMDVGSRKWGGWSWELDINLGVFNEETFVREGEVTAELRRAIVGGSDGGDEDTEAMRSIRKVLTGHADTFTKTEVRDRVTVSRRSFDVGWATMIDKGLLGANTIERDEHGRMRERTVWHLEDPLGDPFAKDVDDPDT